MLNLQTCWSGKKKFMVVSSLDPGPGVFTVGVPVYPLLLQTVTPIWYILMPPDNWLSIFILLFPPEGNQEIKNLEKLEYRREHKKQHIM